MDRKSWVNALKKDVEISKQHIKDFERGDVPPNALWQAHYKRLVAHLEEIIARNESR